MNAKKMPSGNWKVRAYSHIENGKRKYITVTAPTKAEAIRKANEYLANRSENSDLAVSECIKRYISAKEKVLSPATVREYTRTYESGIYDSLADIPLLKLNSQMLQIFISDISEGRAPKTVRNLYGLLSSSLRMFTDKNYKVTLPSKQPYKYNIPVSEDVNKLIANAEPDLKLCILLASVGTLRRGEICGLRYEDVLPEQNAIYIHSDIVRDKNGDWVRKETPKTSNSVRVVELPKEIIDLIGEGEPEEYIYKRTPDTITWRFDDLRDSLGMKCRFHDMRHYAASMMHAIGVPDQYIMERGGWQSDAILKSTYRNALSDMSKKFQNEVNDFFKKTIDIK